MRTQSAKKQIFESIFSSEDMVRMCLGEKLGEGQYRIVFDFHLIPDTVCKYDKSYPSHANWNEYNIWNVAKDTKYAKWFAPVIAISPGGEFLLMKKVRPITDSDKLPKNIPNFFADLKRENFGFINDQVVCIDYQFINRAFDLAFNSGTRKFDI